MNTPSPTRKPAPYRYVGTPPNGIRAPYSFVPLANWVFFPSWAADASHDVPYADGICGTLTFRVMAESPLLVVGERLDGDKHFARAPDGRWMIPGSSLRGMIRNVLEIATFGKMSLVDDRRQGVRDLSGGLPTYNRMMNERVGSAYRARARTGWLRFQNGMWLIYPCRHVRVEHNELAELLGGDTGRRFLEFVRGRLDEIRRTAQAKYRQWEELGGSLDIRFEPAHEEDHLHSRGNLLRYAKAEQLGCGHRLGRLVLTGQPGPRKHMEFIFYDTEPVPLEPDPRIMRAFFQTHEESRDWDWWRRSQRKTGQDIPIFFIASENKVTSLGMTQMYKLPYRLSTHEALGNSGSDHLDRERPDFVETLFGHTSSGMPGSVGLKSRVAFGTAFCSRGQLATPATLILSQPKSTYYPSYILQQADASGNRLEPEVRGYSTLMDSDAKLHGWKRYPARPFRKPPDVAQGKVSTTLHPLDTGAVFTGKLRFHNLKPQELGGLLWALTWGGNCNLVHGLGLAKAYGYGQVRFELGDVDLHCVDVAMSEWNPWRVLAECGESFYAEMEKACRGHMGHGWRESPQLRALLGMADPGVGRQRELSYMVMDHLGRRNEFVESKRRENRFVLPEYVAREVESG